MRAAVLLLVLSALALSAGFAGVDLRLLAAVLCGSAALATWKEMRAVDAIPPRRGA